MGRMLSWFHPNYNAAAALSLKNLLTPVTRIYLLLFQYSAQRWFSKMLAQETFQPMSFSFLEQSIIYCSSSMPFLDIKKIAPYPGAIIIAIPPKLMIPLHAPMHKDHYLKIFNADSADIPTAISVFSSEVVFNDACTRNLPACGFPFLRTVHHLLFLFNAVMFFVMIVSYQKVFLMSMIFVK
jgi:hypothetical protein